MSKITPEELYRMLLEIKMKDAGHNFSSEDLLVIKSEGKNEAYDSLVDSGKIIEKNDIIGSFELKD